MNLKAYLADQNVRHKEFAETLGINDKYMSQIMNGHKLPGKKLKKNIEMLTEGKVERLSNRK